jgi:hypothetical protein
MTAPKAGRPAKNPKVGTERHRSLLEDQNVRAWYDERALRSRLSADVYLRQLGGMCARLQFTPIGIAEVGAKDPDQLNRLLVRYATNLKGEGRLDSYVAKTFDGLRSWLRARRVQFDGFPKLGAERGVSLEMERVPSPDELRRVLGRLTPRGRVIALFMAHAGLRPGVMGSYQARDGLTFTDLPELKLGKRPSFSEEPFVVRVPARLSKTRRAYTTFGTQELGSAILAYLDTRVSQGEKLRPDSPVIGVQNTGAAHEWSKSSEGFLTTNAIVKEIRQALTASVPDGVHWRPYVCRSYCSTRLLIAEGSGKISRDLREAILGHDGGVAARYNVGKRWGDELLKEARASYKRCEPFLSTTPVGADSDREQRGLRLLLRVAGFSAAEVEKLDLVSMTDEEIIRLAEGRRAGPTAAPLRSGQRAVSVNDVGPMLEAGWEYVASLGPDRAVLREPSRPELDLGVVSGYPVHGPARLRDP